MPARKNIDDALAAKLASGATFKTAAAELGIDERTARRRAEQATFRDRVAAIRRELVAGAVGKLADRMAQAADVLGKLLESPSDATRLKAAIALLDQGMRAVTLADLEERTRHLEERLNRADTAEQAGEARSPARL